MRLCNNPICNLWVADDVHYCCLECFTNRAKLLETTSHNSECCGKVLEKDVMYSKATLKKWRNANVPNCGGSGSILVSPGPNQFGETCPGCPGCDPKGESRGFTEWLEAESNVRTLEEESSEGYKLDLITDIYRRLVEHTRVPNPSMAHMFLPFDYEKASVDLLSLLAMIASGGKVRYSRKGFGGEALKALELACPEPHGVWDYVEVIP